MNLVAGLLVAAALVAAPIEVKVEMMRELPVTEMDQVLSHLYFIPQAGNCGSGEHTLTILYFNMGTSKYTMYATEDRWMVTEYGPTATSGEDIAYAWVGVYEGEQHELKAKRGWEGFSIVQDYPSPCHWLYPEAMRQDASDSRQLLVSNHESIEDLIEEAIKTAGGG